MRAQTRRSVSLGTGILSASVLLSSSMVRADDKNVSPIPGDQTECAISKNPRDSLKLFVLCNDTGDQGLFSARSDDGGVSWVKTAADGTGERPAGLGDPSLAWDAFGNLYLSYIAGMNADVIVILLSKDDGQSFRKLTEFRSASIDQPTIVATRTPGVPVAVWVVWNQGGQMMAQGAPVNRLDSVGAFQLPQTIRGTWGCSFGDVAIARNGAVVQGCQKPTGSPVNSTIIVNIDPDGLGLRGFGDEIEVTKTNVGGLHPIPPQPLHGVDAEIGLAFDITASSPHSGRLYMVYTEETAVAGDTDIMLRWSDNPKKKWSDPIPVSNDTTKKSQFLPRLAVDDSSGDIMVCWYDCRGSGTNTEMKVYCAEASSADATPTFGANVMISDAASTSSGRGFEFGDYSGLAYASALAHPVWSGLSTRAQQTNKGQTVNTSDFDAFTDRVSRSNLNGQNGIGLQHGLPSRLPARRRVDGSAGTH